jgi:hypothetical protein
MENDSLTPGASNFLNSVDEHGEAGTASLIAKTRKAGSNMSIEMKLTEDKAILKTVSQNTKQRRRSQLAAF